MTLAREQALPDAVTRLSELARIAHALGVAWIAQEASGVAARVAEGRFYVACVGQFKRGKSTLINALVGEPVLPVGVVPVTSAITVLRHGARAAHVLFDDGRTERVGVETLPRFVTERENPENRKGVRAVEVFLPSPLLARGMCLVDTPGLGSAFGGNAAVTRAFVPHVDAALVVVGADPPISGDEAALAEDVAAHARHLIVVLNKADRLTDEERTEGARFAAQVLSSRLRRPVGRVYEISAQELLDSRTPTRDWAPLAGALDALARGAGADLVEAAEARAVVRLGSAVLREIAERREALLRPLEDSERRIATLDRHVASAERAMQDLGVLLAAEQTKLARLFRARQEAFLPDALDAARRSLGARVSALTVRRSRMREGAFEAARGVSLMLAERFQTELEPEAEALYRNAMARFVDLANEFLQRVARDPTVEALPDALGPESGFRAPSAFQFTELLHTTTRTPLGWLADAVLPRRLAVRVAMSRAVAYLQDLAEANSSRVANDLVDRVAASRARLEAEIRGRLRGVTDRARRALEDARRRREEGQKAVEQELSRLEQLRTQTESLVAARSKGEGT